MSGSAGRRFAKTPHWLVDGGYLRLLKRTDLGVLLVVARYADFTTRNSRPTDVTISKKAGMHISGVAPARKRLRALGVLKAWRYGRRWHYNVPVDIPRGMNGAYLVERMGKDKPRKKAGAYPHRCPRCGQFIHREKSGHVCREIPGVVVRRKSRVNIETLRDLKTSAGSASASPATTPQKTIKQLYEEEVQRQSLGGDSGAE